MTRRLFRPAAASQAVFFAIITPFAGLLSLPAPAAAESTFWGDSYQPTDSGRTPPFVRAARPRVLPKGAEKAVAEGSKPQGPLVIAISIQRQHVKVYDSRGLFAESPISSGMPGHSTPMGVFSVIQKNKFHRSNIYSGAPMPYMQRITWSGIAMHAGVLPGYPASHGCIRMPMSFAMKMWGWTRMGARVVVTPGEVAPADISHPVLAALAMPVPVASIPDAPASAHIQTADASNGTSGKRVMTDIAAGGISDMRAGPADVASVASIAMAEAKSELPAVAERADDGMPPAPMPAPVDLSDVMPPAGDTPASHMSVAAESSASASVTADPAPPVIAPTATAPLIKRNSPVAIFVSRKDARLYVRQNFAPVLDMPVEIASAAQPLGTHVFTARPGADDDRRLQWSVVSLPALAHQTGAVPNKGARRPAAAEMTQLPPGTPEEALSRLTIPADLMARLGEALPPGSSLVVSDQGIAQGETGEGTDFIVRLR